jgi:hypothetical protein
MPFARNDATRYISPTKTPEYLAAGLPVVSTGIHDVIEPYGRCGLVAIADSVGRTVQAMEQALAGRAPERGAVDAFLATRSWDQTWTAMDELIGGLERPVRATAPRAGLRTVVTSAPTLHRRPRPAARPQLDPAPILAAAAGRTASAIRAGARSEEGG